MRQQRPPKHRALTFLENLWPPSWKEFFESNPFSAKGSCTKFPWDFAILLLLKMSSNLFLFLLFFADSEGGIVAGALIGAILAAAIICIIVWVLTKKAKNRKSPNNEMQ